jgi:hypothetical protein
MRWALAVVLGVHGVAHLPGFVSSWRLAALPALPYKTTIFAGRLDVGDAGIRLVGLLWLLAAAGCLAGAAALALHAGWALRAVWITLTASLILCASGWPEARIGLWVNVALLAVLALMTPRSTL